MLRSDTSAQCPTPKKDCKIAGFTYLHLGKSVIGWSQSILVVFTLPHQRVLALPKAKGFARDRRLHPVCGCYGCEAQGNVGDVVASEGIAYAVIIGEECAC